MSLLDRQHVKRLRDRYAVLNGATIIETNIMTIDDPFGRDYWPTLKVRLADGQIMVVYVDCDPEGNGPGHLSGWELA